MRFGRVSEKPGLGDSEGPPCARNDLGTDLAAFRATLAALEHDDTIDRDRVFLFGGSIGAALAPILATEFPVRGVVASGGFCQTWFEHMLEIERTRLGLAGRAPGEMDAQMRAYSELYAGFLIDGLTPGEVIARKPHLAPLWGDAPDGQYGRPAAYYHQVQKLEVSEAWDSLDVPVLVLYGEYDWIMSRRDHERIAAIVNRRHPGSAELVVLARTSHNLDVHPSAAKAFAGEDGAYDPVVAETILRWLEENK
jgi:pimeloyl-ACP methyl ester carboxylesterase